MYFQKIGEDKYNKALMTVRIAACPCCGYAFEVLCDSFDSDFGMGYCPSGDCNCYIEIRSQDGNITEIKKQ